MITKKLDNMEQEEFQRLLETLIDVSKRELMGLYTTPKNVAKLLTYSLIEDTSKKILEPCVGSGTIVKETIKLLSNVMPLNVVHKNVWASDKYKFPLQVANISISNKQTLNIYNIIYQKDFLSQNIDDEIFFTDPSSGKRIKLTMEKFGYIISNLPFIRSERIDDEEKTRMNIVNQYLKQNNINELNMKSDWYQFAIIKAHQLIEEDGKVGFITSNSWLKTKNGWNYILTLYELFHVESVIISGSKRWFDNADVVTTILILRKRDNKSKNEKTNFIKINKDIKNLDDNILEQISEQILLNEKSEDYELYSYNMKGIESFIKNGLTLNICFNDIKWFKNIEDKLIPMKNIFTSKRGVKSTNDKFFYNIDNNIEKIESEYIKPLIRNADDMSYYGKPNSNVLVVEDDLIDLEQKNKKGVVSYIKKYQNQKKTTSQLNLEKWYKLPSIVTGDFVTTINPDTRLFWSRISNDCIINQRLTVFILNDKYKKDKDIIHAFLNSIIGQFMIEASGFGRGLGVLDTTSVGILETKMLNFELITDFDKVQILEIWGKISSKKVLNIFEQLKNEEWINFNKKVLSALGIEDYYSYIAKTLNDSVKMRKSI